MYNITDVDREFKELLEPKQKELENQLSKNLFTQEATLTMIAEAVRHSDLYNFKKNRQIWNAACYINIISYDLKVIAKNLTFSKLEWEKRFFARQAGLLIYESSSDIFDLLGKEFRNIISTLSEIELLNSMLKEITKSLNLFNTTYKEKLKQLRNTSIAHRDLNSIEQLELIYSLSWVDSINLVSAFDQIINSVGVFLQKVMDKSVREFDELK